MVARRGASTLGCLIPLLILAVVIYFAIDFGTAYFRYYQFKDAMRQEARFSYERTDEQITKHLVALEHISDGRITESLTREANGALTFQAPRARRTLRLTILRDEIGSFDASIWSL